MRYTLKDYQEHAVSEVVSSLKRARHDWGELKAPLAFSLTATTGAGKTVIAAAVIEALFDGSPDHSFDPDPGAVVLWFTDDPSLNEQTRFRLLDAADRIGDSRLVVIKNTFDQEKLEAGKVYFLNAQKLGQNSRLVRGSSEGSDARAFTMWDTLASTITDERLTLYLILDEAHRGMKTRSAGDRKERATIVQRLINGAEGAPPIPIVWGISATVERFTQAMANTNRTTYPAVTVPPEHVQDSGLLKDDIRLDFPTETGQFDTALLARATRKARSATDRWRDYAEQEGATAEAVVPLLVVQVPNKASNQVLQSALTAVREAWPDLEPDAVAHVFGEHTPLTLGGSEIPYVSPETVQDRTHIRVLFAKDAISSGWDCPRAEVLMSYRPARDHTHITQLLGRMVRTPLARRVPGNDLLNSVECVLPNFDRATAARVANTMMGDRAHDEDGTGGGTGRRVLLSAVDLQVNEVIPEAVWEAFDQLPSQTLPRKAARPLRRLTALAHALSRDGLREAALKDAYGRLFAKLDGLMAQHKEAVATASKGILDVEGETLVVRVVTGVEVGNPQAFLEAADEQSVEADFKAASVALTADLARRYADHIAVEEEEDDGLRTAHVTVAALAKVDEVAAELDGEAKVLSDKWFDEYRVPIVGLSDDRRAVYDEIRGMSPKAEAISIKRPRIRAEPTEDKDGGKVPMRTGHVMSDSGGNFPIGSLNQWETQVLDQEMSRPGFQAWYRNPSRPSGDALVIAYEIEEQWRRMCPDFIFFHDGPKGMRVSIVDPHGQHLSDALPKLRGLARFADEHGEYFHRIESVGQAKDGPLRVLDLKDPEVREAVAKAKGVQALYDDRARDYA